MSARWVLCLALTTGCGGIVTLQPDLRANDAPGWEDAGLATDSDIRVVAQGTGWPGEARVQEEVTPMRVILENDSSRGLRVRYSDFMLVGADGTTYRAIPPYRVAGTVSGPALTTGVGPITHPAFAASGFEVAPYAAALCPELPPYGGAFHYEPVYFATYYDAWDVAWLPTETMVQSALPEGVLHPDGRLSGYLYFQKVDGDVKRIRFHAALADAEMGTELLNVSIPFLVVD